MKSPRRIFAVIGIILLVGLYAATLILAFSDTSANKVYFKSFLFLCVVVPIILYAYSLVYRHIRDKHKE